MAPSPSPQKAGFHLPHVALPHFSLPAFGQRGGRPMVAAGEGAAAAPVQLAVDFSGRWQKDGARSTPMTDALRLMHINGLMRQAIKLVRGCDIKQEDGEFVMDVTSVIGWFKVRERYKLDGSATTNKRRDWRGGGARCTAAAAAPDRLQLRLEFGDPHGGVNVDEFSLPTPGRDELRIDTTITATSGEVATFTQVYTRKK